MSDTTAAVAAAASADVLSAIIAGTRRSIEGRRAVEPIAALEKRARDRQPRGELFVSNLRAAATAARPFNVIAECKRRSPSRGVLRADYDPVAIATSYTEAGAAAISVLTEPTFFDGSLDHLAAVRAAVDVPLLRKDFVVSEYQLLEAKAAGADAVLLIVAALRPAELKVLHDHARRHGLDVLVEAHDATEVSIAIDAGARIIGVNNRNLRTLQVDVHASETLIARMPADVIAVSESGLKTAADLTRLKDLGYRAFLIGERFMTAGEPGGQLKELLASAADTKGTEVTKDTKRKTFVPFVSIVLMRRREQLDVREDLRHDSCRGCDGSRRRRRRCHRLHFLAGQPALHRSASRQEDRRDAAAVRHGGGCVRESAARLCERRVQSGAPRSGTAARR